MIFLVHRLLFFSLSLYLSIYLSLLHHTSTHSPLLSSHTQFTFFIINLLESVLWEEQRLLPPPHLPSRDKSHLANYRHFHHRLRMVEGCQLQVIRTCCGNPPWRGFDLEKNWCESFALNTSTGVGQVRLDRWGTAIKKVWVEKVCDRRVNEGDHSLGK